MFFLKQLKSLSIIMNLSYEPMRLPLTQTFEKKDGNKIRGQAQCYTEKHIAPSNKCYPQLWFAHESVNYLPQRQYRSSIYIYINVPLVPPKVASLLYILKVKQHLHVITAVMFSTPFAQCISESLGLQL